jgi:hypothetical protein
MDASAECRLDSASSGCEDYVYFVKIIIRNKPDYPLDLSIIAHDVLCVLEMEESSQGLVVSGFFQHLSRIRRQWLCLEES